MASLSDGFNKLAHWTALQAGRASTFALALTVLVIWGVSGPIFQWSDTWQLIINTLDGRHRDPHMRVTSIGSSNTAMPRSTSARSTLIGLAVTIALLRAADGSKPLLRVASLRVLAKSARLRAPEASFRPE